MKSKVEKLLEEVEKYYPAGLDYQGEVYPHLEAIEEVVASKINLLLENKKVEPWNRFIKSLSKLIEGEILDITYAQFPHLMALIKFSDDHDPKCLYLGLSLISKCYTLKWIEKADVSQLSEAESALSATIKALIQRYYPEYEYYSYEVLSTQIVPGRIPFKSFGYLDREVYSLFDLLFDSQPLIEQERKALTR